MTPIGHFCSRKSVPAIFCILVLHLILIAQRKTQHLPPKRTKLAGPPEGAANHRAVGFLLTRGIWDRKAEQLAGVTGRPGSTLLHGLYSAW